MKSTRKPARKPGSFDEYLAGVDSEMRAALEKIRKTIGAAVPEASECIDYGLAAFRLNGRHFVALGAGAKHCAFYLGGTVKTHADELRGFETGKGTIRFQANRPPSAALVRKLVKARIAENPRFRPQD